MRNPPRHVVALALGWRPSAWLAACTLVLAASIGMAQPASALSLIPLLIERELFQEGTELCDGCGRNGQNPSSVNRVINCELALFDDMVAGIGSTAMQTSVITLNQLFGTGKIQLGNSNSNSAHSNFRVSFQVESAGSYGVRGEFFGQADTNQISLASSEGLFFERASSGPEQFFESVELEPGVTYTLEAKVWGQDFSGIPSGGGWSFAVVPEPGTGLLVGLGLTSLGLLRRKPNFP